MTDTIVQGDFHNKSAQSQPPALELSGINKWFGSNHANKDVSLTVRRGSIHGVIGENGAGKSTIMSIVYGYLRADSGTDASQRQAGPTSAPPATPSRPASAWCISISCWWIPSPCVENVLLGRRRRRHTRPWPRPRPQGVGAAGAVNTRWR